MNQSGYILRVLLDITHTSGYVQKYNCSLGVIRGHDVHTYMP